MNNGNANPGNPQPQDVGVSLPETRVDSDTHVLFVTDPSVQLGIDRAYLTGMVAWAEEWAQDQLASYDPLTGLQSLAIATLPSLGKRVPATPGGTGESAE
jgi:hypothetical protein